MSTIRTWLNYKPSSLPGDREQALNVSQAVPDQALTPAQILALYRRGAPIPFRQPVYNDMELPNIKAMDRVDIDNYIDSLDSYQADLRTILKDHVVNQTNQAAAAQASFAQQQQNASGQSVK